MSGHRAGWRRPYDAMTRWQHLAPLLRGDTVRLCSGTDRQSAYTGVVISVGEDASVVVGWCDGMASCERRLALVLLPHLSPPRECPAQSSFDAAPGAAA